jgi:hypothetical protein
MLIAVLKRNPLAIEIPNEKREKEITICRSQKFPSINLLR